VCRSCHNLVPWNIGIILTCFKFNNQRQVLITSCVHKSLYTMQIWIKKLYFRSQYSVCLRAGRLGDRGSIPGRGERIFPSSLCVQTCSEAHPAFCTMGTGGPFPGVRRGPGVTLTTHPHLVPRSRMSRSYISSPPSVSMAFSGTAFSYIFGLSSLLFCIRYFY
jgi:hypothetical protein